MANRSLPYRGRGSAGFATVRHVRPQRNQRKSSIHRLQQNRGNLLRSMHLRWLANAVVEYRLFFVLHNEFFILQANYARFGKSIISALALLGGCNWIVREKTMSAFTQVRFILFVFCECRLPCDLKLISLADARIEWLRWMSTNSLLSLDSKSMSIS